MYNNHELLGLLTSNYSGCVKTAAAHIIQAIDTPMNLRNDKLSGVECNNAYMDMMRRTRLQFLTAPPLDSFAPHHHESGCSSYWLHMISKNTPKIDLEIWDGRDVKEVTTRIILVGDWKIFTFAD